MLRTLRLLAVLAPVALAGMADRASAAGCIYFSYLKGCTQANCTCPDGSYKWDREQFAIRCDDGVVDEDEDLGSCWATPALNTWNSYVSANWTASCGASWSGSLDLCASSPAPNECRLPDNSKLSCVGDPVDLATGSLEHTATDLDLAKGLAFRRHYASDTPASVATRLGKNWRHGFEWSLQFEIAQAAAGSDPLVETIIVRSGPTPTQRMARTASSGPADRSPARGSSPGPGSP